MWVLHIPSLYVAVGIVKKNIFVLPSLVS